MYSAKATSAAIHFSMVHCSNHSNVFWFKTIEQMGFHHSYEPNISSISCMFNRSICEFLDPWQQIASPSQNPLCPITQRFIIRMSCLDFQFLPAAFFLSRLIRQPLADIDSAAFSPCCPASRSIQLPLLCSSLVFTHSVGVIFSLRFSSASSILIAARRGKPTASDNYHECVPMCAAVRFRTVVKH